MICILNRNPFTLDIQAWILATDCHDARRQPEMAGEHELASVLYRQEWLRPGKRDLPISGAHYTLLST